MSKEEMIEMVNSIIDPYKEKSTIYQLLTELGIGFKKTNCKKCIVDYFNIIKEELGLIENAAENSNFNGKYKYLKNRSYNWYKIDGTRVVINADTSEKDIEEFIKTHKGYYKKISE